MMSESEYDQTDTETLFENTHLGALDLDNRVGLSPMTRVSATEDGRATSEMADYYAKFARGGFSVLLTEGIYPDDAHSQGYANQPGLASDAHAEAWQNVTNAVHDVDTPILAQLMHAGALIQHNPSVEKPIAPSAVTPKGEQLELYGGSGEFVTPREMTAEDIETAKQGFVDAAQRAVEAGFDGVEIHGANGYLLDEFLTNYTNEREDEYGGEIDDRVRFPAEVIEAVVDTTPEKFVVGVRLSQTKVNDPEHIWPGSETEAEVVFSTLSAAGADYLHVTEPDITTPAFGDDGPTFAQLADRYGEEPVIANGGLENPEQAKWAVEEGSADLITLATGALANPDWPQRIAEGQPIEDLDFETLLQPDASIKDTEVPFTTSD
jgi:2,4-dienoyl-CoA reductase-like NADH-dependent reductase (Old Yellow Enzyme family)